MKQVNVTFVETPVFTARVTKALGDEEYSRLQAFLAEQPTAGRPIAGTGGARKLRWSDPRRGKGKRGGIRTIYFYRDRYEQIIMLYLYDKNEQVDLSEDQKARLKSVIRHWE